MSARAARSRARRTADDVPEAPPPHPPWGKAALVLFVIGAAHLGLFLLLTASARADMSNLAMLHGEAEVVAAEDPGPQPGGGDKRAIRVWNKRQKLWEAHQDWVERDHLVSTLGVALLASFLVQAGILAVMLHRSLTQRVH